jgi:hypothetical protein
LSEQTLTAARPSRHLTEFPFWLSQSKKLWDLRSGYLLSKERTANLSQQPTAFNRKKKKILLMAYYVDNDAYQDQDRRQAHADCRHENPRKAPILL